MRDILGPGTILGYCTNVHAGNSLEQVKRDLDQVAVAVRRRVSPVEPMGVGLWFSADAVNELLAADDLQAVVGEFGRWLESRGLLAYTINGFPFGDFHQPVVKHAVYSPDWSQDARLEYTISLANILAILLPEGAEGSISTLPLGWNGAVGEGWTTNLLHAARSLADIEQNTGRCIHLDIEPEPGCEIGDTPTFFKRMTELDDRKDLPRDLLRRHLRVCHDVCHAAVMFERPTMMLERCRDSGFTIGKVQISSAPRAVFRGKPAAEKSLIRKQLESFVEPRYLHQTTICSGVEGRLTAFHQDLPKALAAHAIEDDEWRVHFHVPVHLNSLGHLQTTQAAIVEFLAAIRPEDRIHHFEVETYAWNVLPAELQVPDLAEGIALELEWVRQQAEAIR